MSAAIEVPDISVDEPNPAVSHARTAYSREQIASILLQIESGKDRKISQREQAREIGIPESTIRYWAHFKPTCDLEPETRAFLESPAGIRFLHRQTIAMLFVFGLMGGCGPSLLRLFLQLTGLASQVACSDTTLRTRMRRLLDVVVTWGKQTGAHLASTMAVRNVSLGVDETFFAKMVLVAMDVAAGFIFLEKSSEKRDVDTWAKCIQSGMEGLKVNVIQVVGDHAKALCALAKDRLGIPKVEDLWHGQNAITRGTVGSLAAKANAARDAFEKACEQRERVARSKEDYQRQAHGRGHPPNWAARELRAKQEVDIAERRLERATENQELMRQSVCDLGNILHPIDLKTGALQDATKVESELHKAFEQMDRVVKEANLGERGQTAVDKARRLIPSWSASVKLWRTMVNECLSDLALSAEVLTLVSTVLIPLLYLKRVILQRRDTEGRKSLQEVQKRFQSELRDPDGLWRMLPLALRRSLLATAQDCVDLFQRSTGCVEGRNGVLSLHQHQMRGLNPRVLCSLTVVHNYVITRSDGTTAAMRFFGRAPDQPLFEHLCQVLPLPARPRKRHRKHKEDLIFAE